MTSKRVDPSASADSVELPCPNCGAAMVRRVAKRGENVGSQFWGCSTFPKCRSIVPIEESAPEEPPTADRSDQICPFSSPSPEPEKGLLRKAVAAMDGIWRWSLEADEPDATDKWKSKHRKQVLDYLHTRDDGRCGPCGTKMKLKGAPVEQVVPNRFAVFEVSAESEARQRIYYTSALHGMENLQVEHPRCNKFKGNTPDIRRWLHPTVPHLVVANATDGRVLMLPPR